MRGEVTDVVGWVMIHCVLRCAPNHCPTATYSPPNRPTEMEPSALPENMCVAAAVRPLASSAAADGGEKNSMQGTAPSPGFMRKPRSLSRCARWAAGL